MRGLCEMEVSASQNDLLATLRDRLRAYETALPKEKRKVLGQFFTEMRVARLLAALCVKGDEKSVLDPMTGHGSLLEAAADRLRICHRSAKLTGVEIDGITAGLAQERLAACLRVYGQRQARVLHASAFSRATWAELGHRFDLVIANPPYVRYQTGANEKDAVRDGLTDIAQHLSVPSERGLWNRIIRAYSGLSDLSVPSWMLCGLLCAAGGMLGLVVPRTWMNRDYARLVRYFHLRFFQPLYVVEENGRGWFKDALVPATLVISRRLPWKAACVPLHARKDAGDSICHVLIHGDAGDDRSLVGHAFDADDPEMALKTWLDEGNTERGIIRVRREPVSLEIRRILGDASRDSWLEDVDEVRPLSLSPVPRHGDTLVPAQLASALRLQRPVHARQLPASGVMIGQGLRTGCNGFFYVDVEPISQQSDPVRVSVSALLGGGTMSVAARYLRPVLRRQSEARGFSVAADQLAGRVLDLRTFWTGACGADKKARLFADSPERDEPTDLVTYIHRASQVEVNRNGRGVRIPALSAVAPNIRRAKNGDIVRQWYMLPDFAARHTPLLAVPRVNDATPFFILVASPGLVVDANFSTVYSCGDFQDARVLLAVMNSSWCRACYEALGSPMGGGALKLEATHLRTVPVPQLPAAAIACLRTLGDRLAGTSLEEAEHILRHIDRIVVGVLMGIDDEKQADAVIDRIEEARQMLRTQRLRIQGDYGGTTSTVD